MEAQGGEVLLIETLSFLSLVGKNNPYAIFVVVVVF